LHAEAVVAFGGALTGAVVVWVEVCANAVAERASNAAIAEALRPQDFIDVTAVTPVVMPTQHNIGSAGIL
jgi:hypothetical protein